MGYVNRLVISLVISMLFSGSVLAEKLYPLEPIGKTEDWLNIIKKAFPGRPGEEAYYGSVVVLPFIDVSRSEEDEWLKWILMSGITHELQLVKGLSTLYEYPVSKSLLEQCAELHGACLDNLSTEAMMRAIAPSAQSDPEDLATYYGWGKLLYPKLLRVVVRGEYRVKGDQLEITLSAWGYSPDHTNLRPLYNKTLTGATSDALSVLSRGIVGMLSELGVNLKPEIRNQMLKFRSSDVQVLKIVGRGIRQWLLKREKTGEDRAAKWFLETIQRAMELEPASARTWYAFAELLMQNLFKKLTPFSGADTKLALEYQEGAARRLTESQGWQLVTLVLRLPPDDWRMRASASILARLARNALKEGRWKEAKVWALAGRSLLEGASAEPASVWYWDLLARLNDALVVVARQNNDHEALESAIDRLAHALEGLCGIRPANAKTAGDLLSQYFFILDNTVFAHLHSGDPVYFPVLEVILRNQAVIERMEDTWFGVVESKGISMVASYFLADAYTSRGQDSKAVELYQAFLAKAPTHAIRFKAAAVVVNYKISRAFTRMGDLTHALSYAERAWRPVEVALKKDGEHPGGHPFVSGAFGIKADVSTINDHLAGLLEMLGRSEQAIKVRAELIPPVAK